MTTAFGNGSDALQQEIGMKHFWSSRPTMPLIKEVRRLTGPHGIFGREYAIENMVDWCDVSYEEAAEILDCTEEDLLTVLIDADVAPVEGS